MSAATYNEITELTQRLAELRHEPLLKDVARFLELRLQFNVHGMLEHTGDKLIQFQGAAREVREMIDLLTTPPPEMADDEAGQ
jgi:hypothetical protein